MTRWEPGTKDRLQAAAIALFLERGYEETTVQDIAAATGLTERTFFRHYADKREVLFSGGEQYRQGFVDGVRAAPEGAGPLELVEASLVGAADFFPPERRPWSRQRQTVIDANPALRERESLKRTAITDTIEACLEERGVTAPESRLAAEVGGAVFTTAFRQWLADDEARPLQDIEQELLRRLRALVPADSPA